MLRRLTISNNATAKSAGKADRTTAYAGTRRDLVGLKQTADVAGADLAATLERHGATVTVHTEASHGAATDDVIRERIAAAHPDNDYLAIEVHSPGVGSLLKRIDEPQRDVDPGLTERGGPGPGGAGPQSRNARGSTSVSLSPGLQDQVRMAPVAVSVISRVCPDRADGADTFDTLRASQK